MLVTSAQAHDTWLLPDQFDVPPKSSLTLNLTSGMAFPVLETGPKPERIEVARCRLAGKTFEIGDITAGLRALVFKTELLEPGVATLWVKLPPKSIELNPDQVQEYLAEIGAPESVKTQWATMEVKRWREFYTKCPKTFVRVGGADGDHSWAEPVGLELEIIPEKDPTRLNFGDEFSVRVMKGGLPHPGFSLNAVAAGETKGETRKTDASGRVGFRFNKAGQWLLRGTDLRKSSRNDAEWESVFATLTLEVRAADLP